MDQYSKTKMTITQTEISQKVEFDIPQNEAENVTAALLKTNHFKGLYSEYCILNQEFLKYLLSINLKPAELKILLLLMSEMDRDNKVLLNNAIIMRKLNIGEKSVIESVKGLVRNKIVLRQKLDTSKYEFELNYEILNPQFLFKNKGNRENIQTHKALINQETPYIKQYNIEGNVDMVNSSTGEIFYTKKVIDKKPKIQEVLQIPDYTDFDEDTEECI